MQVVLGWLAALAPGGVLAVAYWPPAAGQREMAFSSLTDPGLLRGDALAQP